MCLVSPVVENCNENATVMFAIRYCLRSENYKKERGPTQSSSIHCDGLHSGVLEWMHHTSAWLELHLGVGLGSGGELCPVGI